MNLSACKAGYMRLDDSEECGDIDECRSVIDDCSPEEICINTEGSWMCCLPGYQLAADNETCTDIDECQPGQGPGCQEDQSCFNTPGSHVCCDAGYALAEGPTSPRGYECSPCNLLEGVRYSEDRRTCVHCPPGTTPSQDSTECLDCSGEFNFYTSSNKTRCAECPGGQGATEDHLGCHRIDGQWESWGPWTSCSKSCVAKDGEAGLKYRERQCSPPKYGGGDCDPAGFRETRSCAGESIILTYCPIDGYWEDWTQWRPCSKTCGGGTQFRNRFCNRPQHGGKDCEGQWEESRQCNTWGCPVDGYLLDRVSTHSRGDDGSGDFGQALGCVFSLGIAQSCCRGEC